MALVTFGEIMLRLSPPAGCRFGQSERLNMYFGGSEANTAIALARWGHRVRYITCLPPTFVGEACLTYLRGHGVIADAILRDGDRLGVYFVESGHGVRPMRVLYDRAHSAFAQLRPGQVPWADYLSDTVWFHWSGITPGLTENLYQVTAEALAAASTAGCTISCDLNYRAALWRWGCNPEAVMGELLAYTHVIIANAAGLAHMLRIKIPLAGMPAEPAAWEAWEEVAAQVAARFPQAHTVAITLREVRSADDHLWSAVLWSHGHVYRASVYRLCPIVDRVGAGDAFTAGLIHGLLTWKEDPARTLAFAVAAGALKHTMPGDALLADVDDVVSIVKNCF